MWRNGQLHGPDFRSSLRSDAVPNSQIENLILRIPQHGLSASGSDGALQRLFLLLSDPCRIFPIDEPIDESLLQADGIGLPLLGTGKQPVGVTLDNCTTPPLDFRKDLVQNRPIGFGLFRTDMRFDVFQKVVLVLQMHGVPEQPPAFTGEKTLGMRC